MKILIIKIAAIGDVVMSLPLLTYLRQHYPKAHVTWVCGRQVSPLIRATGLVDRLIEVDEAALLGGSLTALAKLWMRLAGRFYHICIIAHADPRYRILSWPILCLKRRFWDRKARRIRPVPGRYHGEEYVRLLSEIDGPDAPLIEFPKLTVAIAREKIPTGTLIAIAPGGAKNVLADDPLRRWPIESYASLIKKLAEYPVQVLVLGADTDHWVKERFAGLAYVDLIGKLSLTETVALMKECRILITNDSGPLHLAKLAGCRTIALFGPTSPWERVGRDEKIKVLWGGERLSCRPCYDGKTYASCKSNVCMRSIRPEQVIQEVVRFL